MNENILYSFAKDLSQLYSRIKVRDVENCFVKVAQALDVEVEKWLHKAVQLNMKSRLKKPEVLDTLILLNKLKKNYPAGMSYSEFTIAFINDPKKENLKFFLPIILTLRDAASGEDFAILSPYVGILEATRNMKLMEGEGKEESPISDIGADIGTFREDLNTLDSAFREDLNRAMTRPYSDPISTKKKMTRKEKLYGLLNYLVRRFGSEVSMAFEETGQIDLIGITENDMVLRDPVKIMETM